jgi:glycosyltransferase involved in cell wall biosynthesis
MHFALDASRTTLARRTGTERYALEMIRALLALPNGHTFTLYFREAPAPGLFAPDPRVRQRVIGPHRLWTHVGLALALAEDDPDAVWVPAHSLPVFGVGRSVVTVHDLGYVHFPEAHPFLQRQYLAWSTRHSARTARRVLADSDATAADLVRHDQIPADKITVVYPGRDEALQVVDPSPVRQRYGLQAPYILHVGTLQPRKNLVRLIDAVQRLRVSEPDVELVLAGARGWLADPILAAAQAPGVRVLGPVPDQDLAALYTGASVFAFPSLYEGFGFPVLEAQTCEVPVVCASTSSLPEVAGQGALLVDPLDTDALADALGQTLRDDTLRRRLIAAGLDNLSRFSWSTSARQVLAQLEAAAGGGDGG